VADRYTFGDSDLAAQRMALVAEVFGPSSRALLERTVPRGRELALDLGCGPGHSTRMLAEVCRPRRTLGVDGSERYVELARATTQDPAVGFVHHDVTRLPLPEAPVDVVYARLLLAHLPDPPGLVERWRTQLQPGGVVVADEVESIEAPPGVLRDYEELVVALVAAEGGPMYAGPLLAPLGGDCVEVLVDAAVAARMYGMNLATWRDRALGLGLASPDDLDRVAAGLGRLVDGQGGQGPVRWVLRQLAVPAR
jgi:trans-aconitate 2-methyltransferase